MKDFSYEQDVEAIRKLNCPHCNVSLEDYSTNNMVMTSFPPQYPMTCKCGAGLRAFRTFEDMETMQVDLTGEFRLDVGNMTAEEAKVAIRKYKEKLEAKFPEEG